MPVKRETVLAHSIHQSPMVSLHRQESSRYPENRDAAVVREGSLVITFKQKPGRIKKK